MRFYISYITKIGLNVFYEGKKMNLYQQKMKKEARKRIGKERNRTNVLYNTFQEPIIQGERSINHTLFIDGFLITFLGLFLTLIFFICSFGSVFHDLIFIRKMRDKVLYILFGTRSSNHTKIHQVTLGGGKQLALGTGCRIQRR